MSATLTASAPYWSTTKKPGRWVVALRRGNLVRHVTVPGGFREHQADQAIAAAASVTWAGDR